MTRPLALHLAALSLALATCTGNSTPVGAWLIPADACLLIGVDLAPVIASGLFEPAYLGQRGLFGWQDVARECGVDPVASRMSLLFATDHRVQHGVVVVSGDGVGDDTRLRCVASTLAARDLATFTILGPDRAEARSLTDHAVVATVVDPRTVVFVTGTWLSAVTDILAGTGPSAMHGPDRGLFDRSARTSPVWIAGDLPVEPAAVLGLLFGARYPKRVNGSLDLSGGLHVAVTLGFDQPTATFLSDSPLSLLRTLAAELGLGPQAVASMTLAPRGTDVFFTLDATAEDLRGITERHQPSSRSAPPVDPP